MKGAWQIVRFNWPSYLCAGLVIVMCWVGLGKGSLLSGVAIGFLAVTAYFVIASLVSSYWVYDGSSWAGSSWMAPILPPPYGRSWIIQTGFDPSGGRIQQQLGSARTIDLYGIPGVGGASVRRAHSANSSSSAEVLAALPPEESAAETIIAAFALHEIRDREARRAFFRALARSLSPSGRLLIVEHLRDAANFLVYGSGFLHFLPAEEWRQCARQAGFHPETEVSMTPFVRIFVWTKR
jgi:hypothetical protein